jgi:uncharacterized repeat protein (TIGR03803 family)
VPVYRFTKRQILTSGIFIVFLSLLARRSRGGSAKSGRTPPFRPALEPLEDRCLPSTLFVTNTLDDGSSAGSLRVEILAARSGDTIRFDPSLSRATIFLGSTLKVSTDLTIEGLGADQLTVKPTSGSQTPFSLFTIQGGATVTFYGLRIADGNGSMGGGISNSGNLTVTACWLDKNAGGAVLNLGTLVVSDSTFTSNTTPGGAGGALFNKGGTATLSNVTFFGNSASGSGSGGAIDNASGRVQLLNCTLAGNSAGNGGGIFNAAGATTQLQNTLIATDTATNGADLAGTFVSNGNNFIGDATGSSGFTASGDQTGTHKNPLDPQFASSTPQDNGGPTLTLGLASNSAALAAGNPANAPASDQRGFVRVVAGHIDIGAVENQTNPVVVTTLILTPSIAMPVAGQLLAITATVAPLLPALTSTTPTGLVNFQINNGASMPGVSLGSLAPGQWVLTLPSGLPVGPQSLAASFTPTGNATASSATLSLSIATAPSPQPGPFVLYNFGNDPDAWQPWGSLTLVGSTLYGYTAYGGDNQDGAIFRINTDGTGYQVVHSFGDLVVAPGGVVLQDGANPHHDSLQVVGNELLGATVLGGDAGQGVLYAYNYVTSSYRILHELNGRSKSNPGGSTSDGAQPHSNPHLGVTPGGQSVLYGMTSEGGSQQVGTLYQVNLDGSGFQVLHNFKTSDGDDPHGFVIQIGNMLYGLTRAGGTTSSGGAAQGVIFSYNLAVMQNHYTVLHPFDPTVHNKHPNEDDGFAPDHGGLIQVGNYLYGLTTEGGSTNQGPQQPGDGILFRISLTTGTYQILHDFTGATTGVLDGSGPHGSLVLGSDGVTLFGMTSNGGSVKDGVVFAFNTAATVNNFNVIDSFLGGPNDGEDGLDNVVVGNGYLYGLTKYGGNVKTNASPTPSAADYVSSGKKHQNGTIFALPLVDQTRTTLSSSPNPSVVGHAVTLTATVQGLTLGSSTPSGSVTFWEGIAMLGTAPLVNGRATFTTSGLFLGRHTITAKYGGFSVGPFSYVAGVSQPLTQVVNLLPAPFMTGTVDVILGLNH